MENQTTSQQNTGSNNTGSSSLFKKIFNKVKTRKFIIIIISVVGAAAALFFLKGIFIAASVDGSFISRLSIIRELEKQSGKNALDAIITKKLIENEARVQEVLVSSDEIDQEIKKIEAQVAGQGGTLKDALTMRGMTEAVLRDQIRIQKQLEKMLVDKIAVADEEVQKSITDNKIPLPKDKDQQAVLKGQIKDQLKNQKLNQEASLFIANLKNKAKIKYYVNY